MISALPAKVDLTRELVPAPNVRDLTLMHDRLEAEELRQGYATSRQTERRMVREREGGKQENGRGKGGRRERHRPSRTGAQSSIT